jgi:hypothetical protein
MAKDSSTKDPVKQAAALERWRKTKDPSYKHYKTPAIPQCNQKQSKLPVQQFEYTTSRWTLLRYHPEQYRLRTQPKRFNVNPAGRRSGKTEIFKRKLIRAAMKGTAFDDPRFFAAAPTRDQAKQIYWDDLKRLTPKWAMLGVPNESDLIIRFKIGSMVQVLGMDKPERIEGRPWDGGGLDEYGNMKKEAWPMHVRPALSDRLGWCDFIGVPEGRNHYYDLAQKAKADTTGEWDYFWWISADILPKSEIDAAKRDLDELTYLQEYCASFINFQGRAYYAYDERRHLAKILYDPKQPLILCLDFNVAPGVAAIIQEKTVREIGTGAVLIGESVSAVIGEVYIPRNSNTQLVCNRFIRDWGAHQGHILVYGDATGGNKGSAKLAGSDWDIVKRILYAHFGEERVHFHVAKGNPPERDRINAVNSRFLTMSGKVRALIDPSKAPHVVRDFEGVRLIEGGSGEIDKKHDITLTHISDAVGYYFHKEFPVHNIGGGMAVVGGV